MNPRAAFDGLLPVSYTHLDVYKRQVQALPGAVQRNRLAVELHGAARLIQAHHTVGDAQLALAGQTRCV